MPKVEIIFLLSFQHVKMNPNFKILLILNGWHSNLNWFYRYTDMTKRKIFLNLICTSLERLWLHNLVHTYPTSLHSIQMYYLTFYTFSYIFIQAIFVKAFMKIKALCPLCRNTKQAIGRPKNLSWLGLRPLVLLCSVLTFFGCGIVLCNFISSATIEWNPF